MFRKTLASVGALLVLSCTDGQPGPTRPRQSAFHGNDNPAAPQVGVMDLEFATATQLVINVSGGGEDWALTRAAATKFHEPILGLKPGTKYSVSVQATDGEASSSIGPFEWTTPSLPEDFPPIDIAMSKPEQMEPGMTEFNPWVNAGKRIPLVIVDNDGVIRWYYDGYRALDDHSRLPSGNFLFTPDECVLIEVDVLGRLERSWFASRHPVVCEEVPAGSIPLDIESIHHAEALLPNGNFLVLSSTAFPRPRTTRTHRSSARTA